MAVASIVYQNSPAQDVGGVMRDFVTRLFDSVCSGDLAMQPTSPMADGPLPMIAKYAQDPRIEEKQKLCYNGIGYLFILALCQYRDIKIGKRFSPGLYAMLHSLSQEELDQLEGNIPYSISEKLHKVYAKTNCAAYFGNKLSETELEFAVDQLYNGTSNDFLRATFAIETWRDLSNQEHIEPIVYATCQIAKGISFFLLNGWDQLKGVDPAYLQKAIEGDLSKPLCIQALEQNAPSPARDYLLQWVNEAEQTKLERLVYMMTSLKTLKENLVIDVKNLPADGSLPLPVYHTCFNTIDLYNYPSFEIFKRKLEQSLESVEFTIR
jgi:hypothetical protein